ncbi:MAG: hypothetical protein VXX85_03410, partial [Candidatus Margulisiibacteriota bacterium]|nr:hypothetical protein [Candidatus Margulisiibacteriota bacterium]
VLLPRYLFLIFDDLKIFFGLMTGFFINGLEHKNIIDSKANDYGTVHLDRLNKLDLKDQILVNMDEFKQLNNDKTTDFTGRVKSRGPFNRAFQVLLQNGKPALESFLRSTSNPTFGDIETFIGDLTQSVNTIDSNQIDKRSEIITQLSSYTMSLLKKNGVIATGDSGLIKGSGFTLTSKKSEFKQSDLNNLYGEQFNKM